MIFEKKKSQNLFLFIKRKWKRKDFSLMNDSVFEILMNDSVILNFDWKRLFKGLE
jgi:hypothetical protein